MAPLPRVCFGRTETSAPRISHTASAPARHLPLAGLPLSACRRPRASRTAIFSLLNTKMSTTRLEYPRLSDLFARGARLAIKEARARPTFQFTVPRRPCSRLRLLARPADRRRPAKTRRLPSNPLCLLAASRAASSRRLEHGRGKIPSMIENFPMAGICIGTQRASHLTPRPLKSTSTRWLRLTYPPLAATPVRVVTTQWKMTTWSTI